MSGAEAIVPEERSEATEREARRTRRVAVGILAAGWLAAAAIWAVTPPAVEDPEAWDAVHSKRIIGELERIGGKSAAFTAELNDAVAALWTGRTRALTVAGLTVLAAGGWLLARRAMALHDAGG